MTHRTLHMVDVTRRVPVHHDELYALILCCQALDANVLNSAVGG